MDEAVTSSLADDDEVMVSSRVGGTLRFSDPGSAKNVLSSSFSSDAGSESGATSSNTIRSWSKCSRPTNNMSPAEINHVSPKRGPQRVSFEIISARTITQGRKKFVNYTLLVKRVPGLERKPGVLERRYSDFLALYNGLKKKYPTILHDFPFPRKTLLGNFTAEVITERSVAFQHLLAYAFSLKDVRLSSELAEFLYDRELQEAHRLMKIGQFEDAAIILENAFFVQEKVLGESHEMTYTTLCVLIACLNAVDNVTEAQKYADLALQQSHMHETNMTYALLVLCIRLWWAVGKDKRELEIQVQGLRNKGVNVEKLPTLLELVLKIEVLF